MMLSNPLLMLPNTCKKVNTHQNAATHSPHPVERLLEANNRQNAAKHLADTAKQ
jgi:hypothetical protein